jgi:hypothetical protein
MKKKIVSAAGLLSVIGLLCASCDRGDVVSVNSATFTLAPGSNTKYQLSKRYFILYPGDTAFLYGTVACTVITNGTLSSVRTDSVYYRTITKQEEFLTIGNARRLVSPQIYQQASSIPGLDSSSITRFFEQTSAAILQWAFLRDGKMVFTDKSRQMVMPNPLDIGSFGSINSPNNNWAASPLVLSPIEDVEGTKVFEGRSVATMIMAPDIHGMPYWVRDFHYFDGVEIKTYYTMNADSKNFFITGSGVITSHYFTDIGLGDQFQNWSVYKCFPDGRTELTKKSVWFGRGPTGSRVYHDYDTASAAGEQP